YGVRRDLQQRLLAAGYGVRVYVPFGTEWYPYFMRRLAERPANVAFARDHSIARDRFEFQMLYGVRRDLQQRLLAAGYGVRVYVPFGTEWYPYFMRRLAERPANVAFVLRSVLSEGRGAKS
ncbi:MAG TPA: proline dehydrogenase family protein, partial [Candidatus Binatia bacterium]|nr:proline dehydrogenase family protein [Candidatus Binatia bacterium]